MLEAKNLVKIYKPKRGVPVTALDNINLKFPKTGMVFILGKSGSGKSTLLNVLGGLDGFTSGDILVKGESTKGFKQSSYDSYRNTYVGFIFQEYNILDDFTVGANIALAIELQGRKATDEEINEILIKVDLEEYGNRKPNELSGGQKQRVAIARALVKKPEIIMADEPTGALDSVTGRQIFDTLKELSKEKLVMVVSHDREFAETYGDRIIELADGKVISDVTKNDDLKAVEVENIRYSSKNISIRQGYQLTEEDRMAINRYLATIKTDANIEIDNKESKNLSKFVETDINNINTDNSGFKLIKSKLSLKNSFKIGSSGLKYKKFKLVMTVFLSVVAFSLFGFSDTLASYDIVKTTTQSLIDSNIEYASYVKQQGYEYEDGAIVFSDIKLKDEDVEYLKEKTNLPFVGVYTAQRNNDYTNNIYIDTNNMEKVRLANMFQNSFRGYVEFTSSDLNEYGYTIVGNLPDGQKNEIAISKYAYEFFKETAYTDGTNQYLIKNEQDLIGKTLSFNNDDYTITGIIDTNFNYERYRKLTNDETKMDTKELLLNYALYQELESAVKYSLHATCFVGKGFIEKSLKVKASIFSDNTYVYGDIVTDTDYVYLNTNYLTSYASIKDSTTFFDTSKTTVEENEIVISDYIIRYMLECLREFDSTIYEEYIPTKTYLNSNSEQKQLDLNIKYSDSLSKVVERISVATKVANTSIEDMKDYLITKCEWEASDLDAYSDLEIAQNFYQVYDDYYEYVNDFARIGANILNNRFDFKNNSIVLNYYDNNFGFKQKTVELTIVGYSTHDSDGNPFIAFNEEEFSNSFSTEGYLSYAVSNMPSKKQEVKELVKLSYNYDSNYIRYHLSNSVSYEIDLATEAFEVLAKVFFWVGFAFAIFASLMLSNFIANSISYKKQDIGILRAIGSRSNDVFRIFFAESFIIAMINYVITMSVIGIIVAIINSSIRNEVGLLITLLSLGVRQFVVMLAVCLFVAALATFLPVNKNARKKPIDAIRGR